MMRAIYSFKELRTEHYKPIDKNFFKIAKLSVELAKINYTTVFYGDESSYKLFKDKNITFDEVNLLESISNYNGDITSYSKLMAMKEQTEPYVCLDFDTLVFENIKSNSTVLFGYPEIGGIKLFNILSEDSQLEYIEYINLYYKRHLDKYKHKFPSYINPYLDKVPNFSLFMVNNPILVKEIINEIFTIFEYNELEEMGAMFIEQYLIPMYIQSLDIEYKFLYKDNNEKFTNSFLTLKNKFNHYIQYHKDLNFEKNINKISKMYNIKLDINEPLF
jgi:hypothetical protein